MPPRAYVVPREQRRGVSGIVTDVANTPEDLDTKSRRDDEATKRRSGRKNPGRRRRRHGKAVFVSSPRSRSLPRFVPLRSLQLTRSRSFTRSFSVALARSLVRSFARLLARSLIRLTRSRQGDPVSVFPTRPPHVAARRRKRRARHLRVVGGPRRSSSCPSSLSSLSSSSSTSCSSSVAVCLSCSASVDRDSSHLPTITRICREDEI